MLFIPRQANESIIIGDNIEVKIYRIDGARVCLGVQAPREISIHRKEVFNHITAVMQKPHLTLDSK